MLNQIEERLQQMIREGNVQTIYDPVRRTVVYTLTEKGKAEAERIKGNKS